MVDPTDRLLADLEQQAEGLQLWERADQVAALGIAEYAAVPLVARLRGSVGRDLAVDLGALGVSGRLAWVGSDVCGLEATGADWLVGLGGVRTVRGLGEGVMAQELLPVTARLGFAAMLRRLAEERAACRLHIGDGAVLDGALLRVGADFVELVQHAGPVVVPIRALLAVARGVR